MLCVARLDAQKDQKTLVEAWQPLADRMQLPWWGLKPVQIIPRPYGQRRVTAPSELIIAGVTSTEAIPHLMRSANVVVLPSRHEPFGLVVVEAWGVGRPVLAAEIGGPATLLADRVGGDLFPVGDVAALRALLVQVIEQPATWEAKGQAGQTVARERFTWERRSARLWEFYRTCGADLPPWQ